MCSDPSSRYLFFVKTSMFFQGAWFTSDVDIRRLLQDRPVSLNLDCLIRADQDLAILVDILRSVSEHTVTTISMRYCNLRSEQAIALLVELVSESWENEQPKGVIPTGKPNICIIEILYLRFDDTPS
jgi:hypothetical protein